jgi:CDP-diacylglycerol pyrophosphatase
MRVASTRWFWIIPWLLISPCLLIRSAPAADPSALWNITNGKCVPHMRASNDPSPCSIVDLNAGFVVLKDLIGATQFLLLPTERISGIESPAILAPDAPNYWDRAWRARVLTEARAGKQLPREALSLAINSPYGRSQDQLHIHIDCVRRDVRDALSAGRDAISLYWDTFPVKLAGKTWRAFHVDGENLGMTNPFHLLATGEPVAAADMGRHTLAVVGMTWSNKVAGFAVLDGVVDPSSGDNVSAEDLQDHDCALAR